jgi:hypothetical protein
MDRVVRPGSHPCTDHDLFHATDPIRMSNSTSENTDASRPDNDLNDGSARGVSRRGFIQKMTLLGFAGVGAGALLSGCGSDDSGTAETAETDADGGSTTASADFTCDDVSGLSQSEIDRRESQIEALDYVEQTEKPNQNCANCNFYQQPASGENCGGCTLFPGPVHPNGWCKTWVAATG